MSRENHLTDARRAPFHDAARPALEDLDVEVSRAVSPRRDRRFRSHLVADLKLLFAALGAGGSVVPLGDNGRTTRLLSEYAAALRDR
jgi:hypothetical protein